MPGCPTCSRSLKPPRLRGGDVLCHACRRVLRVAGGMRPFPQPRSAAQAAGAVAYLAGVAGQFDKTLK